MLYFRLEDLISRCLNMNFASLFFFLRCVVLFAFFRLLFRQVVLAHSVALLDNLSLRSPVMVVGVYPPGCSPLP